MLETAAKNTPEKMPSIPTTVEGKKGILDQKNSSFLIDYFGFSHEKSKGLLCKNRPGIRIPFR